METGVVVKTSGWLNLFLRIMRGVILLIVIGLLGFAGALEGARRGLEKSMSQSDLAAQVFPEVGEAGADLMAMLYFRAPLFIEEETRPEAPETDEMLTRFRRGEWEINVPEFKTRIDRAGKMLIEETVTILKTDVKTNYPILRDGAGGKLFDWFVAHFGESLV